MTSSWEQSAPHCIDPSRLPDSATLRRWGCRMLISLWFSVRSGLAAHSIARFIQWTYHPCLGLRSRRPYSAPGGKFAMKCQMAETLKQQIPLLDYVEGQDWQPVRRIAGGRLMGLCPLHEDRKPSFLLDPNKNLFYCYGCGRGGDVIRFAELFHGVPFSEAIQLLRRWYGVGSLLGDVVKFYQVQLHRHPEAAAYLDAARCASAGVSRADAHRLRSGPMLARLADESGLFLLRFATSRHRHTGRFGYVCPSHRLSTRHQPLRTQHRQG